MKVICSKKMVTRNQLLTCLGVVTICFTFIQIFLLYRAPFLDHIQDGRQQSTSYVMIRTFLDHCNESHVSCIMVDTRMLKLLVTEQSDNTQSLPCRYLCQSHVYTFTIKDVDFYTLKMEILPRMKRSGYDIQATFSERVRSNIPTHIYLRRHADHALHLVVLHKREGWWWYGADPDAGPNIDFAKNEGALDEFDSSVKVTLDGIELYVPRFPKEFLSMYTSSHFLPCNETRAERFHSKYSRDTSKNATEFREVAVKAIRLIKSKLDDYEVPFWLSSGTLLGWFRQCDIIPYSVDVDIGVFIKDHTEDLLQKLKASSLMLEHKFGKVEDSLQYAFDMGKVKLDIFFFYSDEVTGKMWNGGTDYNSGEKFKYLFNRFHLCWTEFYDMKVRVPCETEEYIIANYGQNWFTPVKSWDWSKSPPNVYPNGEWEDSELDEVIQLWDKNGKRIALEWTRDEL